MLEFIPTSSPLGWRKKLRTSRSPRFAKPPECLVSARLKGGSKVFIIDPADAMNAAAANALLKGLEEPPEIAASSALIQSAGPADDRPLTLPDVPFRADHP